LKNPETSVAHTLVIWPMTWHHLVAGGNAAGLADPSAANKAGALPLPIEASLPSLGTMTRRRERIKRQFANAFFCAAEQ
jgi:hypothetical protein